MFCKNCGKELTNDTKFCNACGTPVEVAQPAVEEPTVYIPPVTQPAVVPASQGTTITIPPIFANFLPELKALFSKNPTKIASVAAKSTGFEWAIWALISLFSFAFSAALFPLQIIKDMAGSIGSSALGELEYPFGGLFGISLLIGLISYVVFAIGFWGLNCLIHKKLIHPCKSLNVLSGAMIPLIIVQLLNMVLGLMWIPLTVYTTLFAVILLVVLLYVGVQRIEKIETSPAWLFTAIVALLMGLVLLIGGSIYGAMIEAAIEEMASLLMGSWF